MASDSAAWSRAQLYLVRGIAVAALGLIATAAYADEDTDALPTRLPEIVVTAQKLNQTLEQVPVSVGTLDGALMDQSGASGFPDRSEEHTSELQSLMRNSYAVFCLKKKTNELKSERVQQ